MLGENGSADAEDINLFGEIVDPVRGDDCFAKLAHGHQEDGDVLLAIGTGIVIIVA